MKSALDTAGYQFDRSHRTPATKAKMAQRIVRTASEGVTELHALVSAAVDEGVSQRRERKRYSAITSPEPPNSFGKSFSFGKPSRIGSTVSE